MVKPVSTAPYVIPIALSNATKTYVKMIEISVLNPFSGVEILFPLTYNLLVSILSRVFS